MESERREAKRTGGLVEPEREGGRGSIEEEDLGLERRWGLKENSLDDELLVDFWALGVEMVTLFEDEWGPVLLVYRGGGDGAVGDGTRRGLSDVMMDNNQ